MAFLANQFEQGRTVEFLLNPDHYAGFQLDSEHNRALGCIDPRPEDRRTNKIIVQTPGGGVGVAHDGALTELATGESTYNPLVCIKREPILDTAHVITAHKRCAYEASTERVLEEMIEPSDFTLGLLKRFQQRYFDGNGIRPELERIKNAAEVALPQMEIVRRANLLSTVDSLYPDKLTVADMIGENKAGVYTFNHHPNIGLDRERMHNGSHQLEVQTYHDSLQASLNLVWNAARLTHEARTLRAAALLWRSVATAGVLIGNDPRVKILEVTPTSRGVMVNELVHDQFIDK